MSHKLLLADDSVTIQRVIELTFADEDVEVSAVGNGQQAIDRIAADPPDIVLADVGMPERDGYEVAAYVKGRTELARIPVLLLTGAFEPIDEARAREVRCDGVLAKPFEPQLLIAKVKELLAGEPDGVAARFVSPVGRPELPAPEAVVSERHDEEPALEPSHLIEAAVRPAESDVSLDDYFDRLDQALATLAGGGSRDHLARIIDRPDPDDVFESAFTAPGRTLDAGTASLPLEKSATGSAPMHQQLPVPVADVFATMLEAEASQPGGAHGVPSVLVAAPATEEIIEQVTRRVLERVTDRALRDAVNEIVLATAERLVREEIERIRIK